MRSRRPHPAVARRRPPGLRRRRARSRSSSAACRLARRQPASRRICVPDDAEAAAGRPARVGRLRPARAAAEREVDARAADARGERAGRVVARVAGLLVDVVVRPCRHRSGQVDRIRVDRDRRLVLLVLRERRRWAAHGDERVAPRRTGNRRQRQGACKQQNDLSKSFHGSPFSLEVVIEVRYPTVSDSNPGPSPEPERTRVRNVAAPETFPLDQAKPTPRTGAGAVTQPPQRQEKRSR